MLASVPRVNLVQYTIKLSSSVGHRGVITRSVPNPNEQSQGLLSTTRVSYSCKTGKRETDLYFRIICDMDLSIIYLSKSSINESRMLVNPRYVIEDPNQRIYNDSIG